MSTEYLVMLSDGRFVANDTGTKFSEEFPNAHLFTHEQAIRAVRMLKATKDNGAFYLTIPQYDRRFCHVGVFKA